MPWLFRCGEGTQTYFYRIYFVEYIQIGNKKSYELRKKDFFFYYNFTSKEVAP